MSIAIAGLAVRAAYVIGVRPHDVLVAPDSILYHDGANLLAKGHGFIDPYTWRAQGVGRPAADHPPAYMLYLALFSFLGFTSLLAHMLASTFLGMATVMIVGLLGKEIGGARVGLVAAAIAAVYPPLVAIDGAVQSESMAVLVVTIFVYAATRYRTRPSLGSCAALGALVGWAATTRPEQLLIGIAVLPLIVGSSSDLRDRARRVAVVAVACALVVVPWLGFNLTRFEEPVYFTTNLDYTIAATNCDHTWYGDRIGFWENDCAAEALAAAGLGFQDGDQSQRGIVFRHTGLTYLRGHLTRLPLVAGARVLRVLNVWDPLGQIRIDEEVEGRETWMAAASIVAFYAAALLGLAGAVHLRRKRELRAELVLPFVVAGVSAVVFMGNTRYRRPAEGVLCVLAAIGLEVLLRRRERRGDRLEPPQLTPTGVV